MGKLMRFRAHGLANRAVFVESPDHQVEDDVIEIRPCGQPTSIAIQINNGNCFVNQYQGEGAEYGCTTIGEFKPSEVFAIENCVVNLILG